MTLRVLTRQDVHAVLCDHHSMLEHRSASTILGRCGPSICPYPDGRLLTRYSLKDNWLSNQSAQRIGWENKQTSIVKQSPGFIFPGSSFSTSRCQILRWMEEMKTYCRVISKASYETPSQCHVLRRQNKLNTRLHHNWGDVSVLGMKNDQRVRCFSGTWGHI